MPTNREVVIPKGDVPAEMPSTLQTLYQTNTFGSGGEALTEESLKRLLKKIRQGKNLDVYLYQDPDLEGDFFSIEIDGGCIAFQCCENDGSMDACFYASFDPDYLHSDEESPMEAADGQSIILKRYTMHDPALAAVCVEYFARTGKRWPGMEWLKGWTDWEA